MNWQIATWQGGTRGAARVAHELGVEDASVWNDRSSRAPEGDWIIYFSGREDLHDMETTAKRYGKGLHVKAILADCDDKEQLVRLGGLTEKVGWSETPVLFDVTSLKQYFNIQNDTLASLPGWLVDFRHRYELTQSDLAATIGVTLRTVQNWETGLGTKAAFKKTRDLRELDDLIPKLVAVGELAVWLRTPLRAHDGESAYRLMTTGRIRELIPGLAKAVDGVS